MIFQIVVGRVCIPIGGHGNLTFGSGYPGQIIALIVLKNPCILCIERLPLHPNAVVKIEFGNAKFDIRQMYPGEFMVEGVFSERPHSRDGKYH